MKYDLQSIHQMVSADPNMKFMYFWGHTPSAKGITQTCLRQLLSLRQQQHSKEMNNYERYEDTI